MNFGDTWYDEHGAGDPLVLLHPGGADSRAWEANLPPLAERFRVFTPDRRGHGRTPDAGELTFDAMARDTIAFIEAVAGGPVELAGCSDGASVGLLVAPPAPGPRQAARVRLRRLPPRRAGCRARSSSTRRPTRSSATGTPRSPPTARDHWPVVKAKLYEEHLTEPSLTPADLAGIDVPTLVMIGDRDEVEIEHAVALYRGLPDAQLAIVPGTSHGLLVEKPELCNAMLVDFFG